MYNVHEQPDAGEGASSTLREDLDRLDRYLAPFSQIHNDYKIGNYHPNPDNRKILVRDISRVFRLFVYLLKSNGMRDVKFYISIHLMSPDEVNSLLNLCKLHSWVVNGRTESLLEGRWHILFKCVGPLTRITREEFNTCTAWAEHQFPSPWRKVLTIMDQLKDFGGWNVSPFDTFQKMISSISQIEFYQIEKQAGLCGLG